MVNLECKNESVRVLDPFMRYNIDSPGSTVTCASKRIFVASDWRQTGRCKPASKEILPLSRRPGRAQLYFHLSSHRPGYGGLLSTAASLDVRPSVVTPAGSSKAGSPSIVAPAGPRPQGPTYRKSSKPGSPLGPAERSSSEPEVHLMRAVETTTAAVVVVATSEFLHGDDSSSSVSGSGSSTAAEAKQRVAMTATAA
jgi:hypothetical protein